MQLPTSTKIYTMAFVHPVPTSPGHVYTREGGIRDKCTRTKKMIVVGQQGQQGRPRLLSEFKLASGGDLLHENQLWQCYDY